jgi:3-phosphoshikimate 1-carboxyvinyltransferase
LPGDKSLAHRALILAVLAEGATVITDLPKSRDVSSTLSCLKALGVRISARGRMTRVQGRGASALKSPPHTLDAGNSATTARLLLGLLAGSRISARISGDASLRRRPMARVAGPLKRMGARIRLAAGGRLPARIDGADLHGRDIASPMPSAQVKSAVLIAGLLARGRTRMREPALSRDHTERMLGRFGIKLLRRGLCVEVRGPARLKPSRIALPGDASSAAFWVVAATLNPGSRLRLPGMIANPTRTGFLRVLKRMGARIGISARTGAGEPRCDLEVRSARLRATEIKASEIPSLIDEVPILALAATQAAGCTRFRGLNELRHKESDRLCGIAGLLRRFGADIQVRGHDLLVHGPTPLRAARIPAQNDHRLAMTALVAGLTAPGRTRLADTADIAVSYPGFCAQLRQSVS